MGPVCWEGVREYSAARRSSSRAGAAGEAPPRWHTGPRYLLRAAPTSGIHQWVIASGRTFVPIQVCEASKSDSRSAPCGLPHYSSHSQCPSVAGRENDSRSCPSISASFSLNLNSSVASRPVSSPLFVSRRGFGQIFRIPSHLYWSPALFSCRPSHQTSWDGNCQFNRWMRNSPAEWEVESICCLQWETNMSLATGCAQVARSLFLPNLSWTCTRCR